MLQGENLWRFFPPTTPPEWLYVRRMGKQGNISGNHMSKANTFHATPNPADGDAASYGPDLEATPLTAKAMEMDLQFVQRAGDVVWIPPGWWHQVYHASLSVGFASQYMNEHSVGNVLGHIVEWNSMDPVRGGRESGAFAECLGGAWEGLPPKQRVQKVASCACIKVQTLSCNPAWFDAAPGGGGRRKRSRRRKEL